MSDTKPREWWISQSADSAGHYDDDSFECFDRYYSRVESAPRSASDEDAKYFTHVIEKSAYDEARAEVERLNKNLWNATYADTQDGLKKLDVSPEVLARIKTNKQLHADLDKARAMCEKLAKALSKMRSAMWCENVDMQNAAYEFSVEVRTAYNEWKSK